jgi:hypothetical protein
MGMRVMVVVPVKEWEVSMRMRKGMREGMRMWVRMAFLRGNEHIHVAGADAVFGDLLAL